MLEAIEVMMKKQVDERNQKQRELIRKQLDEHDKKHGELKKNI